MAGFPFNLSLLSGLFQGVNGLGQGGGFDLSDPMQQLALQNGTHVAGPSLLGPQAAPASPQPSLTGGLPGPTRPNASVFPQTGAQPQVTADPSNISVAPVTGQDIGMPNLPSAPSDNFFTRVSPEGQTGADRMRIIGGTMQDVASYLGGNPQNANHLSETEQYNNQQVQQRRSQAATKALQDAVASGDPKAIQKAALTTAALSGDSGNIIDAQRMYKPDYKGYDQTQNVYALDPTTGQPIGQLQKGMQKPQVQGGMQYVDGQWVPIPGYTQQQQSIYDARQAGRVQAGPVKSGSGAPGAMVLPKGVGQPWTRYQGGN